MFQLSQQISNHLSGGFNGDKTENTYPTLNYCGACQMPELLMLCWQQSLQNINQVLTLKNINCATLCGAYDLMKYQLCKNMQCSLSDEVLDIEPKWKTRGDKHSQQSCKLYNGTAYQKYKFQKRHEVYTYSLDLVYAKSSRGTKPATTAHSILGNCSNKLSCDKRI